MKTRHHEWKVDTCGEIRVQSTSDLNGWYRPDGSDWASLCPVELQEVAEMLRVYDCSVGREPAHDIRPAVQKFAQAMEETLRKHDDEKGGQEGWRKKTIDECCSLLDIEAKEFCHALEYEDDSRAMSELVDMANLCMMMHDILGKRSA